MRDKERIRRITSLLAELWEKNPDYRFYQMLINNGLIEDSQLWHIEDDKIEEHLKKAVEETLEDDDGEDN
jgi:hypothetical protein